MNLREYNKVKGMSYLKYCKYLQNKYGIPKNNFFRPNWTPVNSIKRTSEGLYIHHVMEDHSIMLGRKEYAIQNPYEWQMARNLLYCDMLEHLLLHILICENPHKDKKQNHFVGFGGAINYLVPELNDVYSGWVTKQDWRLKTHKVILKDKNVYFELIKRFKRDFPDFCDMLYHSFTETFPISYWSKENDKKLINELKKL